VAQQPSSNAAGAESSAVDLIHPLHLKDITMNTKAFFAAAFAVAAVTTFGAGSALATETSLDLPVVYTSTVSRAEVHAEALRARAAGQIEHGELSVVIADTGPALSRAQVKAETLEAIRVGAISRHEQSVLPTAAQLDSIRLAGLRAVAMTMASL
jgi:Domain of unknown function (DUF4148)